MKQRACYLVKSPAASNLSARYGGTWHRTQRVLIDTSSQPLLMNDFRPGIGCCTITALTTVFSHIKRSDPQSSIPDDLPTLFNQIERISAKHGYQPDRGRTNPLRIGAIVRELFRYDAIRGKASSAIFLSARKIMQEIDAGRPMLLNIAFGHYHRHTVTIMGYECWQSTNRQKSRQHLILLVHDGWNIDVQRLDHAAMSNPWSRTWSIFSVTRIWPTLNSDNPERK